MADFLTRSSVPVAGRTTGNRDIVTSSSILRWLMEGKVFHAGLGAEDAEENSQGAMDDTKATYALQSPSGTSTIVVPILLKLSMTGDGGALTNWQVMFTRAANDCATALTTSGTSLTFKRNMNPLFTSQPQSKALYGDPITVSALTNADYVSYHYGNAIDAVLTTGLVGLGDGKSNTFTANFLKEGVPPILSNGAAMLVYIYTGSTDSVVRGYMQWAEVTAADLY